MRPALAVLLALCLGACVTESDPRPAERAPKTSISTVPATSGDKTTTASPVTTFTTTTEPGDGELIGLTDNVTIKIVDSEDG